MILALLAAALQPQPLPALPADPAAAKPKKICRKIAETGTNIPRTDCRTAEEWKAADKQSQADRQQIQRMQNGGSGY